MNALAIRCKDCGLRKNRIFRPLERDELVSIEAAKASHIFLPAGAQILRPGEKSQFVYTMYEGWALRYCERREGSRQILDVLLPGDVIGLSSVLLEQGGYPVRALTAVSLCALDGKKTRDLVATDKKLAFDMLQARLDDEHRVDERLFMLGRMNAEQRVGYFLVETYHRLQQLGLANHGTCQFPLTRSDVADAVGLSRVHVMRALRALRANALADLRGRRLRFPDIERLAEHVGYSPGARMARAIL